MNIATASVRGIALLRVPMPLSPLMRVDQFSKWHRYQEKHNEGDAIRTAKARAKATGKRFRIVDADGRLIDLIYP